MHAAFPAWRCCMKPQCLFLAYFLTCIPNLLASTFARILHDKFIRHQRNKLTICGLIVLRINIITKKLVDVFDFTARPRHFYRMADGAFHLGGRSVKALGNARV